MKVFNFRRIHNDGKSIFGVVLYNNKLTNLKFLENWAKRVKTGEYFAEIDDGGKYKGYWKLKDVEGRTEIINGHEANFYYQLEGCQALGKEFGEIDGESAILRSKEAVKDYLNMTKDDKQIKVIIEEPEGWKWIA